MTSSTKKFAPTSLMKLSIADLKATAKKAGITFESTATKQQLTDLIIQKQEACIEDTKVDTKAKATKVESNAPKVTKTPTDKKAKSEAVRKKESRIAELTDKLASYEMEISLGTFPENEFENQMEFLNSIEDMKCELEKLTMPSELQEPKKTLTVSVDKGTKVVVREKAADVKPSKTEPSVSPLKVGVKFKFTKRGKKGTHEVIEITKDNHAVCSCIDNGKKWTTRYPLTHKKYSDNVEVVKTK